MVTGDSNRRKGQISRKQDPQRWGPAQPQQDGHGYPQGLGGFLICVAPRDDYGMDWEEVKELGELSGQGLLERRHRGQKLPGALGDWLWG